MLWTGEVRVASLHVACGERAVVAFVCCCAFVCARCSPQVSEVVYEKQSRTSALVVVVVDVVVVLAHKLRSAQVARKSNGVVVALTSVGH